MEGSDIGHGLRGGAVCVVGDVHGHLQLALCTAARWQAELNLTFDAVLLCGDVGTFTDPSCLDGATVSHAKGNECELEFMLQWAADPPAPWLEHIFHPADAGGLGLCCPVVMVHGNHEGFEHLERLVPRRRRVPQFLSLDELPAVDTAGFIRLLPSGWRTALPSGHALAAVGGIEPGQRRTRYHPMAYVDEEAVFTVLDDGPCDLLITHQGPSGVQLGHGSDLLQPLLDAGIAKAWFHGHSVLVADPTPPGPGGRTLVVPLGDVAFPGRGRPGDDPGLHGWSWASLGADGGVSVTKQIPPFWRDFRRHKWVRSDDGRLVSPSLVSYLWKPGG